MVSITGSTLSDIVNDDTLSATDAEIIIDQAIDLLNLNGETEEEISNMSGTAGSKTLTVEGYERGAILDISRIIYLSYFKGETGQSKSVDGISITNIDLMSNPQIRKTIETYGKLIAQRRADRNEIEVDVG